MNIKPSLIKHRNNTPRNLCKRDWRKLTSGKTQRKTVYQGQEQETSPLFSQRIINWLHRSLFTIYWGPSTTPEAEGTKCWLPGALRHFLSMSWDLGAIFAKFKLSHSHLDLCLLRWYMLTGKQNTQTLSIYRLWWCRQCHFLVWLLFCFYHLQFPSALVRSFPLKKERKRKEKSPSIE